MINNELVLWFKRKVILTGFLVLYSLILSENVFSIKHWSREYLLINYNSKLRIIRFDWLFIDYEFGPWFEHGYLEKLDFNFTVDGQQFQRLMSCYVKDQIETGLSVVSMRNKLPGSKIMILDSMVPPNGFIWTEGNLDVKYENYKTRAYISVRWYLPFNIDVKQILVMGKWSVSGLDCGDSIYGVVYEVSSTMSPKEAMENELKRK